jgi:cell division protein ZipA
MSDLRWIIGLIGLGVIAALYLWGRSRAAARQSRSAGSRVEPSIDRGARREGSDAVPPMSTSDSGWMQFPEPDIRREPRDATAGAGPRKQPGPTVTPRKILVLHIRAAAGEDFTGPELVAALHSEGLRPGQFDAYHYLNEQGQSVFMVANMMEPGTIPQDDIQNFSTAGITAFMVLPGPGKVDDLARMVASCRRLASRLGGEVLDESRSTLTNQGATHMKEELIEFLRQSRLGPLA